MMSASGRWNPHVVVSAPGEGVFGPSLSVDPHGDALVAWWSADGVRAAFKPAHARWQPPVTFSPVSSTFAVPDIALDTHGNALAAWLTSDSTDELVQAAYRSVGDGWQTPVNVFTGPLTHVRLCPGALLALDGRGNATAVWSGFNGHHYIVQAASRPAPSGTWQAPVTLSATGRNAAHPQLAMNTNGTAVAGWTSGNIFQTAVRPH
jgi:hypothetical protein